LRLEVSRYLLQKAASGSTGATLQNFEHIHKALQQDQLTSYSQSTITAQQPIFGTECTYPPPWKISEEANRKMQEFENRTISMKPGTLPLGTFTWKGIKAIWKMGFKRTFWMIWQLREIKWGKLIGTDQFGNKYYESDDHIPGRRRWVEYASDPYEASKVTPEWHGWLHYVTDEPPTQNPFMKKPPRYTQDYYPNLTGTDSAYHPSDTTTRYSN